MRAVITALAIGLGACASSPPPAPPPAPKTQSLREPAHLSAGIRTLISQKMQGHSFEMSNLVWSVLFLDREVTAEIADTIAEDPKLARPLTRDATELNSALPPLFFDLQDQLVERARTLSKIAKDPAQPPDALAVEMGALTQVCVRCHSVYLYEEPTDEAP